MSPLRLALLLFVVSLAGCDSSVDRNAYETSLQTDDFATVARLELRFEMPQAGDATVGTYAALEPSGGFAPSGVLDARRPDGEAVVITLDPGTADGGTVLTGRVERDGLEGTWETLTIAGPRYGGPFSAVRQ